MTKKAKRMGVFLLCLSLIGNMVSPNSASAAKKPRLNKKKITVAQGKKKVLKVKNTKKEVKWKIVSGKACISLKKKGKRAATITGKRKGKAKVRATVGKKKLVCKVTVVESTDNTASTVTATPAGTGTDKSTLVPSVTNTASPAATDEVEDTQVPAPTATTTATEVISPTATAMATETASPIATATATASPTPSASPVVNPSNAPENADEQDVSVLETLIATLAENGVSVSEDMSDSDVYTWSEDGRLVGIDWSDMGLTGTLDVSGLTALTNLDCSYNDLTGLDVTNCTNLTYLSCGYNQLMELDVTDCISLEYLYCYNNQLTELDVTNCTALISLDCDTNQIVELDVSNCTCLQFLYCYSNQITELDLTNCTELEDVSCDDEVIVIGYDISDDPSSEKNEDDIVALEALIQAQIANGATVSEDIDDSDEYYWSDGRLIGIYWSYKGLTGELDLSAFDALKYLSCYSNQLTELDVENCTALENLYCSYNNLTELDVANCIALESLSCYSNQLTVLDVTNCTGLTYLYCGSNQLTELDVTNCMNLTDLYCGGNQLTELDVANCTGLTCLDCYSNELTELDLANCIALERLYCGSNQLTELDVTNCTVLEHLSCYNNELTEIDVAKCTGLTYLDCDSNQLTELDVTNCTALESLYCGSNQLTELDVTNCMNLTDLYCGGNQLTELDVAKCASLAYLSCTSNQLTELDVTNCTALEILYCGLNQLTELDVTNCTALETLSCYSNQLTELDVTNCTSLTYLNCDDDVKIIGYAGAGDTDDPTSEKSENDVIALKALIETQIANGATISEDIDNDEYVWEDGRLVGIYWADKSLTGELDLSAFNALEYLHCSGNQLTELNVTNCTGLTCLDCFSNQLTCLDVTNCTALVDLFCGDNQLTELDLTYCTLLDSLSCDDDVKVIGYAGAGDYDDDTGKTISTQSLDLTSEYITAVGMTSSYSKNNATVLDEEYLAFGSGACMCYVDFSEYLTANDIDLSDYDSLQVTYQLKEDDGSDATTAEGSSSFGKIALVSSEELNGYSSDSDGIGVVWLSDFISATEEISLSDISTTYLASCAGFNFQVGATDDSQYYVISDITLYKGSDDDSSSLAEKNKKDVTVLETLIQSLITNGATVSEDIDDVDEYVWEDGRLVGIYWAEKGLTGELDVSGLTALTYLDCSSNALTELDVSSCDESIEVYCDEDVNVIRSSTTSTGHGSITPDSTLTVDGTTLTVDEESAYYLELTELNETTLTCDAKGPTENRVHSDIQYNRDGSVTFTSSTDYNSGVSYYINPCTSEEDLVDASSTLGEGYAGYNGGTMDVSEYDYIRLVVTSENDMNCHTYNGDASIVYQAYPGGRSAESYEDTWVGPTEYYWDSSVIKSAGSAIDSQYYTRTLFVPISSLIENGMNPSTLTAIAFGPNASGEEVTIDSISFVKVGYETEVTAIEVTSNKDTIANGKVASLTATITPSDATRQFVTWESSDEELATIDYTGTVVAADSGSGEVTFTAYATDGSGVKGSITLTIGQTEADTGETISTQSLDLTSEYITAVGMTSSYTKGNATVTDEGYIAFDSGACMCYVDFSEYLTANDIDLSDYDSLQVTYQLRESDGSDATTAEGEPGFGKIALVSSKDLNGYTNDSDEIGTTWLTDFVSATEGISLSNISATYLASYAGFNFQVGATDDSQYYVISDITLCKMNEDDIAALEELIQTQIANGATVSEDIYGSYEYDWEDGRLVGLYWGQQELEGELDLSGLTALQYLDCIDNRLTKLDVTTCISLKWLYCYYNEITELDISKCTNMCVLSCSSNKLTELDVTNCTNLQWLECGDNDLIALDVTNCTILEYLYCEENMLTELDVTNCTALKDLNCYSNLIKELDLSYCTNLINVSWDDDVTIIGYSSTDSGEIEQDGGYVMDLTSSDIVTYGMDSSYASAAAEVTSEGLAFSLGASMCYVDFSTYLEANDIDLADYESIEVTYQLKESDGSDATTCEATYGKVALATSDDLNGYSGGVKTEWSNNFVAGTMEVSFLDIAATDLATVAGFNFQMSCTASDQYYVITEIKLVAN